MACDESLTVSISPACAAVNKRGGIAPDFYVGTTSDVESVTYDGTVGFISGITFKTDKGLIKVNSERAVHTYTEPIQDSGKGGLDLFQQTFTPKIYYSTQAEINAIQDIVSIKNAFVIFEDANGTFKVAGIAKNGESLETFALSVTGGDDPTGTELIDETVQTLIISGDMPNKAIKFGEGTETASNRSTLDGYVVT